MDKKYKKILFDLADEASYNENYAIEYLQEHDINVKQYIDKGVKEIRRKAFLKKASQELEKQQLLLAKAIQKIKSAVPQTIEHIENAIRQKNPAYQFRNLKDLDENQLRDILIDSEIIEYIEELEKKI